MNFNKIADSIFFLLTLAFIVLFLIPILFGLFISFTDWMGVTDSYNFIGIENYNKFLENTRFESAVFTTIKYIMMLLPASLVFGYINASFLNKLKKLKATVAFLTFFPYIMTPVTVSLIWNQIYQKMIVAIGKLLDLSILSTNLLSNSKTALWAVSIVDLWILIPYTTLLFYSSLSLISQNQINAAILDGAKPSDIFFYIKLPYMLPTIGTVTTVIFSYCLTSVDTIMALTTGGPGRTTETLYYVVYQNSVADKRYGYGAAEGIALSLVSIGVYFVISKITNNFRIRQLSLGD